jgi:predicted TIM-barrel fold metal-dependent hydrolase
LPAPRAARIAAHRPTSPLLIFAYSDPALVDDAARDFPAVAFILAHGGVNNVEAACLMAA